MTPTPPGLYPLTFGPIYKQKVWGGRSLTKLGRDLPGDASVGIGESWEIADLTSTSVSGGGGSAEHSVVAEGSLAGKTIRELIGIYGQSLLGPGVSTSDDGGFPLLIKFLDAKENLSVQVHPSPAYAAAHPGAHLKSEAWYVVDAQPGAVIYKGLKPGVTEPILRDAIRANTDEAVVPLLNAVPAVPGDCHYLPSGTLHALGAGVMVAEVQTPSDTTFRVYDWGRTTRELHVEQALACIDFADQGKGDKRGQEPLLCPSQEKTHDKSLAGGFSVSHKAACDFFRIDEYASRVQTQFKLQANSAEVWITLAGQADFISSESALIEVGPGHTVLLPAKMDTCVFANRTSGRWLRVTLP